MSNLAPMEYETDELAEVPVKIKGVDYVLLEADSDKAVAYRNKLVSSTIFDNEGRPSGVGSIADGEPTLVASCLFKVLKDKTGVRTLEPVDEKTVRSWRNKIVTDLFNRLREISNLKEEEPAPVMVKCEHCGKESLVDVKGKPVNPSK